MVIGIIIGCALILLGLFYLVKFIQKQRSKPRKPKKEKQKKSEIATKETMVKNVHLIVKSPYMMRKEVLFWKYLNTI